MEKKSLKLQWQELLRAAHTRGLRIRKSDALIRTEFRAMNPRAARLLNQSCPCNTITHSLSSRKPVRRKIMDVRHEILEHDKIGELARKGVPA